METKARKNALISGIHLIVGLLQRGLIDMKRIGIFHDEFTRSHHAKAWTAFVAKFGLDLVDIYRQLFVTVELIAHKIGDIFFMGRSKAEVPLVAILETLQFV